MDYFKIDNSSGTIKLQKSVINNHSINMSMYDQSIDTSEPFVLKKYDWSYETCSESLPANHPATYISNGNIYAHALKIYDNQPPKQTKELIEDLDKKITSSNSIDLTHNNLNQPNVIVRIEHGPDGTIAKIHLDMSKVVSQEQKDDIMTFNIQQQ